MFHFLNFLPKHSHHHPKWTKSSEEVLLSTSNKRVEAYLWELCSPASFILSNCGEFYRKAKNVKYVWSAQLAGQDGRAAMEAASVAFTTNECGTWALNQWEEPFIQCPCRSGGSPSTPQHSGLQPGRCWGAYGRRMGKWKLSSISNRHSFPSMKWKHTLCHRGDSLPRSMWGPTVRWHSGKSFRN